MAGSGLARQRGDSCPNKENTSIFNCEDIMTRLVHCEKLGKELPGLNAPTYPGELGQKIFNSISMEAWQMWLKHQTMLINEKRLNVMEPESRAYLASEMEKFLFGGDYEMPEGYVPPESK